MPVHESTPAPITDEWTDATTDQSVVVADGYGVTVSVRGGALVINDGIAGQRRIRKIGRVPRTLSRLLILSRTGTMTLDAATWLADSGVPWSQVAPDGRIVSTSGPAREDPRLLRAQALAPGHASGLEVTRALLTAKLSGQSAICRDTLRVPGAAHNIDDLAAELDRAPELDDCRSIEGAAAVAYWRAWADRVSVPFSPAEMFRVPANWNRYGGRTSEIHPYPRNIHATDPVNAMLNYVYRIAETEAVHACRAVGLAPSLGILHADKPGRDSFALDLIESIRPHCDRIVLQMLDVGLGVPVSERGKPVYANRRWFHEDKTGQCKLVAPLTHTLASRAADIGAAIRPYAEQAARIIASEASGTVRVPVARKRETQRSRVPATSYRPARLRDEVTTADLLPDELWNRVREYLPGTPAGPYGHRKTGRNRDASLDRDALAAIVSHELLGTPWGIPRGVPVSVATCRARLLEYQWAKSGGMTVWDHIASEVQGYGHLAGLVAA